MALALEALSSNEGLTSRLLWIFERGLLLALLQALDVVHEIRLQSGGCVCLDHQLSIAVAREIRIDEVEQKVRRVRVLRAGVVQRRCSKVIELGSVKTTTRFKGDVP